MKKWHILRLFAVLSLLALLVGCAGRGTPEAAPEDDPAAAAPKAEHTVDPAPAPTPAPEPEPEPQRCIVLDPGHQAQGNSDPEPLGPGTEETKFKVSGGTCGTTTGLPEYELTLAVCVQLRDALEAEGYRVVMTRETDDVDISNKERAELANREQADAYLRIHANGSDNTAEQGMLAINMTEESPYNAALYPRSRALSEAILETVTQETGAESDGVWDTDTMSGINWSTVPVTILEMGYMTNPVEDRLLADAAYQEKIVHGIVNGLEHYFAALPNR